MKKLALLTLAGLFLISCADKKKEETVAMEDIAQNYQSIGAEINDEEVITSLEMAEKFKGLKPGDTVDIKFSSKVNEVCQNKGCWMKVDVDGEEAMVKFKDYGFFMPKDLAGQDVIMNGKAFVEEMSVEEQRHYAEDAGKTQEEIDAITEPKRTLSFLSDGVLIPEYANVPE